MRAVLLAAVLAALVLPVAAAAQDPPPPVATVDGRPITRAAFDHWFAITNATGYGRDAPLPAPGTDEYDALRDQTMQQLISFKWIAGEAVLQGVHVGRRALQRQFRRQRRATFPTWAAYQRFLRRSLQTTRDVKLRVRMDMTSNRIRKRVVAGIEGDRAQQRALDRFIEDFRERWRAVTVCAEGYVISGDCSNGPPE